MKKTKKIIKYIGCIIILLFFFRGFIYRTSVNYSKVKVRNNIRLTNHKLIKDIDAQIENKKLSIEDVIKLSSKITSDKLEFTFNKISSNPNLSCDSQKGNCIGYSSLFNSVGNHIIKKQKMTKDYEFIHLVGKLYFFGSDIHSIVDNPFFKDHDYNEIKNRQTGEKIFIDPSVRDYLGIEYVLSE